MIDVIAKGQLVRVRATLEKDEAHATFRTERIARGLRIGSLLGRIVEVCHNGCYIWVRPPEMEDDGPCALFRVDELAPLLEEDTDGTESGAQHA